MSRYQRVAAPRIVIWRLYIPRGLRDRSPPVGFRNEAPIGGPESVCIHCLHNLTITEMIKIWKFHTIHLLILDQYVSPWEVKRHFFWGGRLVQDIRPPMNTVPYSPPAEPLSLASVDGGSPFFCFCVYLVLNLHTLYIYIYDVCEAPTAVLWPWMPLLTPS